jgi:hypothetical protein
MITSTQVRNISSQFLNSILRNEAPGVLKELLEEQRFDRFVRDATVRVNQIELYVLSLGLSRWDWADFVQKVTASYGRSYLKSIQHRYLEKLEVSQ